MDKSNPKFCIYCFEHDLSKISKAHIFPKSIGGKIKIPYTCVNCNSIIGSSIEGKIKKCLFFAIGIDKLKIQPKDKAYQNIKIQDEGTGGELFYKNDQLIGKSKVIKDKNITRGTKEFVEDHTLKWIEKYRPNWVEYYKNEKENGSRIINIAGDKFVTEDLNVNRKTNYTGNIGFPNELLAKLTYELLFGFGFPYIGYCVELFQETFVITKKDGKVTNIDINKLFYKRISSISASRILDDRTKLFELDYQPFHRVVFRVSKNDTAYLKLTFFEIISFLITIGKVDIKRVNKNLLNINNVFLISENDYQQIPEEKKQLKSKENDDLVADLLWNVYRKSFK